MQLTVLIDVMIGLTLVYLGASLFVTIINEYIVHALNLRGTRLRATMQALFDDPKVQGWLAANPTLAPFFAGAGKTAAKTAAPPSYVDPAVLGRLLVGALANAGATAPAAAADPLAGVKGGLAALPDGPLKAQLQALAATAGGSVDAMVKSTSDWADRTLTLLGESYKQHLRLVSLAVGIVVAVGLNLDTVAITAHLYRDKQARDALAAQGERLATSTSSEVFGACLKLEATARAADPRCAPLLDLVTATRQRSEAMTHLPMGWPLAGGQGAGDWAIRAIGWLLTALALSLGAPFWFDLLNRLVDVRHGARRPEPVAESKTGG